ncbi:hypothetical protein D9619_012093 [Psilocybe cf. subviscida]|uniref:Piwi domain-containing protein n=1 Tax=Psilocybe cf. subviscida TaxID=2480587 RepID=A0A8H5B8G0_9AGAR|nr:hypothetical protein D9619_012093 [Psilocybe cf. subviscida]
MPPRKAASLTGHAKAKGQPLSLRERGGASSRGSAPGAPSTAPLIPDHITTVCVKRKEYGTSGRAIQLFTNSFRIELQPSKICHYDVIEPKCAARVNLALFTVLQDSETTIFTPKIVYDGQKNAFAPRELALGESGSRKFAVSLSPANSQGGRPPRIYNITLTRVAHNDTEVLEQFLNRQKSHDNDVLTTITALNTAMRMAPNLAHPHNKRAFFTDKDRREIGGGFEVWRGIFQSVRSTFGRLLLNIDLAATLVYREGPLINLCNEFMGKPTNADPRYLTSTLSLRDRSRLERFIFGIRITVSATTGVARARTITGLSTQGANAIMFTTRAGNTISVADYFRQAANRPLQYPNLLCVTIGNASIPLESCVVVKGQIIKKGQHVGDQQKRSLLEFSTISPPERLQRIQEGLKNVQEGHSDYVAQFGMKVNAESVQIKARVLDTPVLQYGGAGTQALQKPQNGAWNMTNKTFVEPATIDTWAIAIFENQQSFRPASHATLVKDFLKACGAVGIKVNTPEPFISYMNTQALDIEGNLRQLGRGAIERNKKLPSLIVVILPFYGNEIWRAVKNFGDMKVGVATQCLKASNCTRAKDQFWANVMLKINGKLGGVNMKLKANPVFSDPAAFSVVMGADVIHPPPGAQDRPSFAALVGSTNLEASRYVATASVQEPRREIISGLKDMVKDVLQRAAGPPKRLIFYRDGVSEGEFQHVKDRELPMIQEACKELKVEPKITLIVVGKRHHNQLFPKDPKDADRSKNAPAGTVVDQDITHPTDFDFFLLSHAGIKGTSRCSHYSVLHDENTFTADAIQQLSFALCHTYAPSTRSVSIPAPIYYADRVCSRAKTHFDSDFSDGSTQASGTTFDVDSFKHSFQAIHAAQRSKMYFN